MWIKQRLNPHKMWWLGLVMAGCGIGIGSAGFAQDTSPLSAIEWLDENTPEIGVVESQDITAPLDEPPVVGSALSPEITVTPLDQAPQRTLGLLPFSVTGLSPDLWNGASLMSLRTSLSTAQRQPLAAGKDLLVRVLLAETHGMSDARVELAWASARIEALLAFGAVEPARALAQQAEPTRDRALFDLYFEASLLSGAEEEACRALGEAQALDVDAAVRIYCTALLGDFQTSVLLFGTASSLDVLGDIEEALLARFLDPELFEDAAFPAPPMRPTALQFRLFEAAGARMGTATLPIKFAHFDLSSTTGWKAQLEAAERLARAGVLPSNQLLGLYTARRAAASGGIWDRVAAVQAFDRAVSAKDLQAIEEHLPKLWAALKPAGLLVIASDIYAPILREAEMALSAHAQGFVDRMILLSSLYESVAPARVLGDVAALAQIAHGQAVGEADHALLGKIGAVFAGTRQVVDAQEEAVLGVRLLGVLELLGRGSRGDEDAFADALASLRGLGLEDLARRAALQMLILRKDL